MHHRRPAFTAAYGKTVLFKSVCLAVAAFLFLALLQMDGETADGAPKFAAVTANGACIRQSAGTRARIVANLRKGDVVKVLSTKKGWYRVATSGGKTGWCQTRYLAGAKYAPAGKGGNTSSLDWPSDNISLTKAFTYPQCMQDMNEIASRYGAFARIETIGTSVMGSPINAIVLGNRDAQTKVLFQAAIHARESITSLVAMRQVECLLKTASIGGVYRGASIANLLENVEVWVVPVANPDGVRLVYEGLAAVPASMPKLKAALKKMNGGSANFSRWKANAHGVDLNRNFDAGWAPDPKYRKPGPQNYAGTAPFTEPESVALRDLAASKDFALTMSYHSSGEIIYWYNPQGANGLNLSIAKAVRGKTGYRVLPSASQIPSGGFKDWFVAAFGKPGFTVEVGTGSCPLPQNKFDAYWQDMRYVMLDMIWTAAPKSLTSAAK